MERKIIHTAKKHISDREKAIACLDKTLQRIAESAKKILGEDTKVYVFGSYVKGNFDKYLSDVDILIVSKKIEKYRTISKRAEIILKIKEEIKDDSILQIHLVTPKEFEYYKFFVDKIVEI